MPNHFRVLTLAASPFPMSQGSQVLLAGLAETLQERGNRVEIVAYAAGEDQAGTAVPVRRIPRLPFGQRQDSWPSFSKPFLDLLLARQSLAVARETRPNILHAHNFEGLLVALWVRRRTGIPVVYHMHNLMEPELPTYFRFWPGRWAGRVFGRWVDRNLPRRADACIVLHTEAAVLLQHLGVAAERVHLIPPGIHLGTDPAAPPQDVRRRWGFGPGPLVLYSGNLDPYQDLPFLHLAFQEVRQAQADAVLVLATHQGIGVRQERALQRTLGRGEALVAAASWPEMWDLLVAADVAVAPRQVCWGFPIKVLNYMAAGRPIVAAAGSAQGLQHLRTAWVAPNSDVGAFAQGILALLQDRELAGRIGQSARSEVECHYTWPACAAAVEQVYAQLVEQNQSTQ
jgi:1,2-diacylglycerol 3-alpha-glucosyltransferase